MLVPWSGGIDVVAVRFSGRESGTRDPLKPGLKKIYPMAPKSASMTENEDIDIREVQTATLRRQRADRGTVIVSIPEAIAVAGLEDGGSFRFDPSTVEEIGMLAAVGSEETVDGRSERYARNIRQEGRYGETLRLVIPHEALSELVDPESIDWDNPPKVNVWAGDRFLAFEMADYEERTVRLGDSDLEDES